MTARTMPARPDEDDAGLRPVPWRRMAGVTWRQHRFALAGVAVLLGGLAVWLWIIGTPLHRGYAAAVACHPASSAACQNLISTFAASATSNFMGDKGPGGVLLQLVPALIGAFVGAPLLAREMETGTFRYAWTQGFGRRRWAIAKLVTLAIAVTAAAQALSLVFAWYNQPFFAAGYGIPFSTRVFDLNGVAFAAWTLAAFAIGALAGMLIRRVVPAIATTLVVYAGLAFTTAVYLRQHYLTPLLASNSNLSGSAWVVSEWYSKAGQPSLPGRGPQLVSTLQKLCPAMNTSPAQCLTAHGYTQWQSYQPGSRFWTFQCIEAGWLLVLSALLIAVAVWLVRRRAA